MREYKKYNDLMCYDFNGLHGQKTYTWIEIETDKGMDFRVSCQLNWLEAKQFSARPYDKRQKDKVSLHIMDIGGRVAIRQAQDKSLFFASRRAQFLGVYGQYQFF